MSLQQIRERLENRQILVYFGAVACAAAAALLLPGTTVLESVVNPALALMLYATFLQVPLAELRRAFGQVRFLAALLLADFVLIPLLVAGPRTLDIFGFLLAMNWCWLYFTQRKALH